MQVGGRVVCRSQVASHLLKSVAAPDKSLGWEPGRKKQQNKEPAARKEQQGI